MLKERFSYIISIIITVLLLVMAITDNPVFLYISLVIAIVYIANPYVIFSAYFVSSLSGGFFSAGAIGASRLFSIITIVSLLFSVRKSKESGKYYGWGLILTAFSLFSCLFSITGNLTPFFNIIQCILVTCLLISSKLDNNRIISTIIIDTIAVLIAIMVQVGIDPSVLWEERFSIGDVNSNNFAMMCAQLGAITIGSYYVSKNKLVKILMLVAFVTSIYIIILSGSRSSLLGLLSATLFVFLASQKNGFKKNILPVLIFIIIGIVFIGFLSNIDSPILARFNADDVVESGGAGRWPLMKMIVTQVIPQYPLFGVGMGGGNIIAVGVPKQCHSIVVDPISQIGFVGYILFLIFIIPNISRSFKSLKMSNDAIIPLALTIAAIINGIGEVVFFEKFFWNDIALCGMISITVLQNKIQNSLNQ